MKYYCANDDECVFDIEGICINCGKLMPDGYEEPEEKNFQAEIERLNDLPSTIESQQI